MNKNKKEIRLFKLLEKLKKRDRESLEIKYGHKKVFKSYASPWV